MQAYFIIHEQKTAAAAAAATLTERHHMMRQKAARRKKDHARLPSLLRRSRFSAAEGFGDGGSDLLIALDGLVIPLVLLPAPSSATPFPFPSPSPEALDRVEDGIGRRLPPTLVLPPAAVLPRAAPVPFIRAFPVVNDERLERAATPPAPAAPRPALTPEAGGGLAVEDDEDSREDERRPTEVRPPPPATDFLPPAPAVLERPSPKLPPWLLLGLGGAVEAALPDARAARPP